MGDFINQAVPVWVILAMVAAPIIVTLGFVLSIKLPDEKSTSYDEIWKQRH